VTIVVRATRATSDLDGTAEMPESRLVLAFTRKGDEHAP
jgi:hypothetical protein